MPRGINGEYYDYRLPKGSSYFTHPFLWVYNYIMHSADDKNPYLNIGIAPNGSLDTTSKFFKFINSAPTKVLKSNRFNSQQLTLLELLKQNGVSIVGITPEHLHKAFSLRQDLINLTAPSNYNLHYMSGITKNNSTILGIDNGKVIGDIDLLTNNRSGYSHIGMVRNLSHGAKKGIQERMTNSAILVNKSLGGKGVVSGEVLLSPEKTTKMYSKYKDKEVLHNNGEWQWSRNNPGKQDSDNNPVYLLKSGTYETPTKSVLFNPTIIDNKGQMHIDWNNLDIFKSVIPLIGGSYVYKRSKESNR